ncbi:MAG: 4-hydroxy-2-oxo-heptane-1,7-dioate aldolase [Maritimibacter sp.]|nr:4-hydroxy-2-oxo-heptane-1,7-dioate aldolase [Maritimibacter sp.]
MAGLRKNAFKAGLRDGRLQRGLWCTINDSLVAEMCAGLGYDWMLFDTEHSALDPLSVLPLLQAVAPYPVSPIVRPGSLNAPEIKKLLDLGAQTLLIPMVQNAGEAAAAVAAVEYPPAGIRGVSGLTRATAFAEIPGYHKAARDEIALLVQVESMEAVEQIEAIAAVPGVDGIFVGPADLAAALGYAGEPSHPAVVEATLSAVRRIVAAGKPAGFLSADESFVDKVTEAGATFVSRDIDLAAMKRGLKSRLG